jgi:hypothetical protein
MPSRTNALSEALSQVCRSRKATEPRVEQMSVPKASGREGKDAI